MRRDWNLVRSILLYQETDDQHETERLKAEIDQHPENIRNEHWALVIEAGLLEGAVQKTPRGDVGRVMPGRITWAGHDFLAVIHNEGMWKKITGSAKTSAGTLTFDLLKELLQQAAKTAAKQGLQHLGVPGFEA